MMNTPKRKSNIIERWIKQNYFVLALMIICVIASLVLTPFCFFWIAHVKCALPLIISASAY